MIKSQTVDSVMNGVLIYILILCAIGLSFASVWWTYEFYNFLFNKVC